MNEEPPAKRLSLGNPRWWMLAIFLAFCGWQAWGVYQYRSAVREAKEEGFYLRTHEPLELIRQDWHNVLKKNTWCERPRELEVLEVTDFARYRKMLHRLHPTDLTVYVCESVDGLEGLTSLQMLDVRKCPALQNVNGLEGLTGLKLLSLRECPALQNVDGLKGLTDLQAFTLGDCPALHHADGLKGLARLKALELLCLSDCATLQNLDSLKGIIGPKALNLERCVALENLNGLNGLTNLQDLSLNACRSLQNVDALKSLTGLQRLNLNGCEKIPAAALRELRAAIPNTDITFPDGTKNPPQ